MCDCAELYRCVELNSLYVSVWGENSCHTSVVHAQSSYIPLLTMVVIFLKSNQKYINTAGEYKQPMCKQMIRIEMSKLVKKTSNYCWVDCETP